MARGTKLGSTREGRQRMRVAVAKIAQVASIAKAAREGWYRREYRV